MTFERDLMQEVFPLFFAVNARESIDRMQKNTCFLTFSKGFTLGFSNGKCRFNREMTLSTADLK
jgi:hypothetical protein